MTGRSEWDEQWQQMVSLLQRGRRDWALSLAEAQRLFDAAPGVELPPDFARSVVSLVVHTRSEQLQTTVRSWLGYLVFHADTLALSDTRCVEPPSVIGWCGDSLSAAGSLVVQSNDVDTSGMTGPRRARSLEGGTPPTDSVVYDVLPGFHELDRSTFRRVRQGTVTSAVYLDGRGLDVRQVGWRHELWCDSAGHEWENRASNRGN